MKSTKKEMIYIYIYISNIRIHMCIYIYILDIYLYMYIKDAIIIALSAPINEHIMSDLSDIQSISGLCSAPNLCDLSREIHDHLISPPCWVQRLDQVVARHCKTTHETVFNSRYHPS